MSTPVLPPYEPSYNLTPQVTPFTYRDGLSYLARLERLVKYINRTLIPFVEENYAELAEAFETQVNLLITQVNAALAEQTAQVDTKIDALETFVNTEIADLTTYVNEQVQLIINDSIQVQDPVMAGIMGDDESDTRIVTDAIYADKLTAARVDNANSFVPAQTFSEANGIHIGNKLQLKFVSGFAGDRLHLTGLNDSIMPYIEVVPSTLDGTDGGGSIAGIQVYRTLGGGGVPDREFVAIEAKEDAASAGPIFRFGTWASGTGIARDIGISIGVTNVVNFSRNDVTNFGRINLFPGTRIKRDGSTPYAFLFRASSNVDSLNTYLASNYSDQANIAPTIRLSKNRGSFTTPSMVQTNDVLGDYQFGTMNDAVLTDDVGVFNFAAGIRALADENHTETARGSKVLVRIVLPGTTTQVNALSVGDAPANLDTGLFIYANNNSAKSLKRVVTGAIDSGGSGFRTLLVAN